MARRTAVAAILLAAALAPLVSGPRPDAHAQTGRAQFPEGAPDLVRHPEPVLPTPAGWPFPDRFPRTSGTGRYAGGAFEWSDFLYDDHGAVGLGLGASGAASARPAGTYTYADGPAAQNGADLFRVGIGADSAATYWRVDWNTLLDPSVPIAEFAIDTDARRSTGVAEWPGDAGVRSPGIERAVLLSSRGGWVVDAVSGTRAPLPISVDRAARSFVLRVPSGLLPVPTTWTVRVAGGLANPSGDGFAPVPIDRGARPGQPAVYNVGFRDLRQESTRPDNPWNEADQARRLASGDVSSFAVRLRGDHLLRARTTPEATPAGYSVRWYVSGRDVGQGIHAPQHTSARPNLLDIDDVWLGRVQPFGVYVPRSEGNQPLRLTWILHGGLQNHNGMAIATPRLVDAACERQHALCAFPLGRGGNSYRNSGELDLWEVWRSIGATWKLDPERTAVLGYSMGGTGAWWLAVTYPGVFARIAVLAGPTGEFIPLYAAEAEQPRSLLLLFENLVWTPVFIGQGELDPVIPAPSTANAVDRLDFHGYRYKVAAYPAEDHSLWLAKDHFELAAAYLASAQRQPDPWHVIFAWYPKDAVREAPLGIGPRGAWWVRDLVARTSDRPDSYARVDALAYVRPGRYVRAVRTRTVSAEPPSPALVTELAWAPWWRRVYEPTVELLFTNVASATADVRRAGFAPGQRGKVRVRSDGPVDLTLLGADPSAITVDSKVFSFPRTSAAAPTAMRIPAGTHDVVFTGG